MGNLFCCIPRKKKESKSKMNDEVVDGRSRVTDVGDDCTAVGTAVELAYDKPSTEIVTPTIYDKSFLPKRHESAAYGVFLTPTRYPRVRSFFEADPTSQRWFYDDLRRAVSAAEDRHTEDRVRKFFGTITLEITTLPMFDLTYRPIEEIRGVRMIVHAKNGNTVPSDLGNFYRSPTLRCLFDANPLDFLDRHCGTQPSSISIAAAVQTTDLRLSRGAFQQALPAIEDRQPDPISAEQMPKVDVAEGEASCLDAKKKGRSSKRNARKRAKKNAARTAAMEKK